MATLPQQTEYVHDLDRLRELIPGYTRAGMLRRVGLPDGGVEFVEVPTDRVFARFDGRGRLVP